jgi:hypothetical protein
MQAIESDLHKQVLAHSILMAITFVLLIPLGILIARQR